jgi:hypothetical protein
VPYVTPLTLTRSDATYGLPLKPRIEITSLDSTDTYFTFSPLENLTTDLNLVYLDTERASFETGSFNAVVEDSQNIINKDHLRNAKVKISFGKTASTTIPYFIGYADISQTRRPRNNYQEYLLTGPSTKIQATELMLLIRKAADDPNNPKYGIANLIIEAITTRKWRPLNRDDIQEVTEDQGGRWLVDLVSDGGGVSDELNALKYSVIVEVFTTLWDFLERMSAITGASWDLDYDAAFQEIISFGYPSTRGTGINIKSTDLASPTDNPLKTSYLYNDFSIEDNSSIDANVATRLYTTTITDQVVINSQNANAGATSLVDKAIAQQLIIQNDQRRITDLMFIVSKVGVPTSPNDRVNGDIVMDFGDNTPRGRTLATFNIPISDIKTTPTNIFVNDVDVKVRFLQGENKIWLRLFQRSGIKGDPDNDPANTIFWHHNGVSNSVQPVYTAISSGVGKGEYKLKDTLAWASDNKGPIYAYSVFSNIRRLQARTNPSQAKIIRLKEAFTDTSFLGQIDQNNLFLSRQLAARSKARRSIQGVQVTIPNNFLFKPYNVVDFGDSLSNEFQSLAVQRARYVISALPGDQYPLGALFAELTLSGSFNALLGNCSCL